MTNLQDIESFYRSEHSKLWRSLLAFSGDPEIASDAVAEVFVQAINRGKAIKDLKAWVWRSAYKIASGLLKDANTNQLPDLESIGELDFFNR